MQVLTAYNDRQREHKLPRCPMKLIQEKETLPFKWEELKNDLGKNSQQSLALPYLASRLYQIYSNSLRALQIMFGINTYPTLCFTSNKSCFGQYKLI